MKNDNIDAIKQAIKKQIALDELCLVKELDELILKSNYLIMAQTYKDNVGKKIIYATESYEDAQAMIRGEKDIEFSEFKAKLTWAKDYFYTIEPISAEKKEKVKIDLPQIDIEIEKLKRQLEQMVKEINDNE